ncbi:DISARM system phospholipase D-like protein DrmC [Chroococcus sp. FPU101]|uniref:DISARM system phospholipase D-like protein DrmC n=1 Tax=Chroococcus sp. FPU101 TaxID=1974212 RepID=UPI001A8F2800|nr:DISARM system phospholipase D-like protein DrmC [Chroococcus sp. FPU101]GFE72094.1 Phospholipase D/Transphosphatidylase [Chroococcus sp. FPU101]
MSPLHSLSYVTLIALAEAILSHRLYYPFLPHTLDIYLAFQQSEAISTELSSLYHSGMGIEQIACLLKMLADEKCLSHIDDNQIDLVWTGQHLASLRSRDTAIVVKELFSAAQNYILLCSYAIDRTNKAETLFRELADRMEQLPDLKVIFFLNLNRPHSDERAEAILVREFADYFHQMWPGKRLPQVFYDPRSLSRETYTRSCLHAKCIVIDDRQLFVTSANFTEAAHERNLELGILLKNPAKSKTLRWQLESLISQEVVKKLFISLTR